MMASTSCSSISLSQISAMFIFESCMNWAVPSMYLHDDDDDDDDLTGRIADASGQIANLVVLSIMLCVMMGG
jgi:hypothetical protein